MKLRRDKSEKALAASPRVAANGLLDRRIFLQRGVAGGLALAGGMAGARAATVGDAAQSWQKRIGAPMSASGSPSRFVEDRVQRGVLKPYGAIAPGTGVSMTPLHELQGTITPNRLHFERHHNGVPDIDPDQHSLTLHGLVKRPLVFDMVALSRYPMTNRTCFIECSGNSFFNTFPEAKAFPAGMIHGLVSCSEWTGVPLSVLLDEAGVDRRAKWIIAEGADAATMARSIPLNKALDDVIVALYQNGEPVRPEQGYPMRLVNPGYEGNTSIKWLHSIKVSDRPAHARDETSKYTDLLPDGRADQFTFTMGVKSVILRPSGGMIIGGDGFYEISGLAWSGAGRVRRVEVSADGGKTWADAHLHGPLLDKSLTRFSMAWHWGGSPVQLQSRATDDKGRVQNTRAQWKSAYGAGHVYHYNAIQSWVVNDLGEVSNAYL
jgi:sulfane dehydrogenase subunit SoxC